MSHLLRLSIAGLNLLLLVAAPAAAGQWNRSTVHGGELNREVTRDGRVYSGETTRSGPNGATYSSNSTCFDGVVNRCKRSFSATGTDGQTWSGTRYSARGPYRTRSVGAMTGPAGNSVVGVRRPWR